MQLLRIAESMITVIFFILMSTLAVSGEVIPKSPEICIGEDVRIRLTDSPDNMSSCNVTTPTNVTFNFLHDGGNANSDFNVTYWDSEINGGRCGFRVDWVSLEHVGWWYISAGNETTVTSSRTYLKAIKCPVDGDDKASFVPGDPLFQATCGSTSSSSCFLYSPSTTKERIPPTLAKMCSLYSRGPSDSLYTGDWTCNWAVKGSMKERSSHTKVSFSVPSSLDVGMEWKNSTADKGEVNMWCNLKGSLTVLNICRWVSPKGKGFYSSDGLASGRYAYFGRGFEKGDCGISIRQPLTEEDVGVWRCELYLSDKSSRGSFLELGIPKRTRDQKAKTLNPWGKGSGGLVVAVSGKPLIIGCSALATLSFCFLRHPNGTVFVPPIKEDENSLLQPYGRGRELGDCGMKILRATKEESGKWECMVGVDHGEAAVVEITVDIQESELRATSTPAIGSHSVTMRCETVLGAALENCVFERPDRKMFTVATTGSSLLESDGMNKNFSVGRDHDLTSGICSATVASISSKDVGEWSCVGRILGHDEELRVTFKITAEVVSMASAGIITSIVTTLIVLMAIGAVIFIRLRGGGRSAIEAFRGTNEERLPTTAAAYRRNSNTSSEGSQNGRVQ